MRVLVTGGAGYIGSVTTELLLDAGHDVAVFDNLERGHRRAVDGRARFLEGDLRDARSIQAAMSKARPDAVMHFAAYALVPESMRKPEMYFGNNVAGGINLAEAMLKRGVERIVFSSSCATYGQPGKTPIAEDTPQNPTNPYGESKLLFERILRWHSEVHGIKAVFLRYFNACGATKKFGEDHDPETHLIPLVLKAALGRSRKVTIFGDDYDTPDGTCLRDYVHITDLSRAHILALKAPRSDAFNLGNGRGHSVLEVVEAARAVTGRRIPAQVAARRPGDPARLVADISRAKRILKWEPRRTRIDDMIESAWAWHRAHPRGYGN
jgi:UDP-glucose 4-epimerase